MSRARVPLPTDIVALAFDGRVYPNQAKPWDRLGLPDRARPLEGAIEQWFSFATGKHTWVNVRGATIRGLISARRRAKRSAWEVETLIDAKGDGSVVTSLFERMSAGIGRQGAERVFLRLDADSHLVRAARQAGFFPYQEQTLFRLDKGRTPLVPTPSGPGNHASAALSAGPGSPLRPRAKGELFGVWQLYNSTVPANVRAIEGTTFREWQAALEPWGGRTSEFVVEEEGVITAWAKVMSGETARVRVLAGIGSVTTDGVLRAALAHVRNARKVLCLAPDDYPALAASLDELDFAPAGRYVVMAKRLARTAAELVPETSGTAMAVN